MISVRAEEVRRCLRDADLAALRDAQAGSAFEAWKRLVDDVAETWDGDLADQISFASGEIAGIAARRWESALDEVLVREGSRAEGYTALRAALSDDWHQRLQNSRRASVRGSFQERHVMDGVLPSSILAAAILETLADVLPESRATFTEALTTGISRDNAMALGATFLGTSAGTATRERGRPQPKGLGRLAAILGDWHWNSSVRARALGLADAGPASRAGGVFVGRRVVPITLEAEPTDDGACVLVAGRFLFALSSKTLERIAWLVPQAAGRRLHELHPEQTALARLSEALATYPSHQAIGSILGLSLPQAMSTLQHRGRVYPSAPRGSRQAILASVGAGGRRFQAIALADADGAHAGYAAFDPLSREFHGHAQRVAYDLDGHLRGFLREDDGGWRFFEGRGKAGLVTVPEELSV